MSCKSFAALLLAILLMLSAQAQVVPDCSARITVVDTVFVSDNIMQYHLQAPAGTDSLHWMPDSLFADPSAADQWVTVTCGDSLRVSLTAIYDSANLFHWQQPDFVRTHTGYNYFTSPDDGDFCQPRSITVDTRPHDYCSEMTSTYIPSSIIIRPDTLRPYIDSIQPFFQLDTVTPVNNINRINPSLYNVPNNPHFVPFYTDTIFVSEFTALRTYVINTTQFAVSDQDNQQYSMPVLLVNIHFDDTTPFFFYEGRTIPLCDTTLTYIFNVAFPQPVGIGGYIFNTGRWFFNQTPRPHGTAVFRFYEVPTPYFNTTGSYCISKLELLGNCTATDSLLLTGTRCSCTDTLYRYDTIVENQLPWTIYGDTYTASDTHTYFLPYSHSDCDTLLHYNLTVIDNIFDTVIAYICPHDLPYSFGGTTIHSDTLFTLNLLGFYGQDSIVTYILHVNSDSDTTLYDTIVSSQLPWGFLDSLFTDSVSNMPFTLANEIGCDSIIYYNLYIFWEGDHCDSSLSFYNVVTPNGDGINDRFVIGGLFEHQCYPYNSLIIVDRTGRMVYRAENIYRDDQFWNPADTRSPAGTYFYRFVGRGINHATQHNGCIEVLK